MVSGKHVFKKKKKKIQQKLTQPNTKQENLK